MYYQDLRSRDHISIHIDEMKKLDFIFIPELICDEYKEAIYKKEIKTIDYSLNSQLKVDIEDLKRKIYKLNSNNILIILTDYFGVTDIENVINALDIHEKSL